MPNILEALPGSEHRPGSVGFAHRVIEAMKLAFADRAHRLGDPAFVDAPTGLVSTDYARQLSARIDPARASPVPRHGGAAQQRDGRLCGRARRASSLRHGSDHELPPAEALAQPRFHRQWRPDRVRLEGEGEPDLAAALRALGHDVRVERAFGATQVIGRDAAAWLPRRHPASSRLSQRA